MDFQREPPGFELEEIDLLNSGCRHRRISYSDLGLPEVAKLLEQEEGIIREGCHLPSTPEDYSLLDQDIRDDLRSQVLNKEENDDDDDELNFGVLAQNAVESAEEFVRKVWETSWKVCNFHSLPTWLQDNDYLLTSHRPPLPSFYECFKSIFRVHTETGNIWTHMLGCIAFMGIAAYMLASPSIDTQEKLIFLIYFLCVIICTFFSSVFHTVHCHSEFVGKLFSKLDYCGIAILIMGSFVPWLYYGFYCEYQPKVIYLGVVITLGVSAIIVSLWDKFSEPRYRHWRVVVFMGFGLSGVIPAAHYLISQGFIKAVYEASLGWLLLMALLYIMGALFYALRVPERFFPGKCDVWFQSHQIFHVFVIAAALVHYHGICKMAVYRLTIGDCMVREEVVF